jgi:AraC-like DNA-binding protein
MPELLFAIDNRNWSDCQQLFRGGDGQEYYDGDYSIEPGAAIDVRAERRATGSSSVIRLTSKSRLVFRRTRAHVRDDPKDATVFWFVRRGRLRVSDSRGARTARPGDFLVTRSTTPFVIDCEPDADNVHEVLHLVAPTHAVRGRIADDVVSGYLIRAGRREFALAEMILTQLVEDDGQLQPDTAAHLVETTVQLISHAIRDRNVCGRLRQTVLERRREEVLRFIEVNLSNPKLCTNMVAQGCGISPRYLSYVLNQQGVTFSDLVWSQRLARARAWLAAPELKDLAISEIAYDAGFKSPAHFSRMFTRVFRTTPRGWRASQAQ